MELAISYKACIQVAASRIVAIGATIQLASDALELELGTDLVQSMRTGLAMSRMTMMARASQLYPTAGNLVAAPSMVQAWAFSHQLFAEAVLLVLYTPAFELDMDLYLGSGSHTLVEAARYRAYLAMARA